MDAPEKIEVVGDFLALCWNDGKELIIDSHTLRANSPSAEQTGETDIFGKISGGTKLQEYAGVSVRNFERVGNYAIRLIFSDGHASGIYSWEYLANLESNT